MTKKPMSLLEYMIHTRLTYRDLSKLLGVGASTIHHWTHGRFKPRRYHVKKVLTLTKGNVDLDISPPFSKVVEGRG